MAAVTARRPGRRSGVVGALLNGISLGVMLLILGVGVLTIVVPTVIGGIPLTVLTGSMRPHLPPGTLVVVKPTEIDEIQIGDVLTYQLTSGQPALVTHRVIAVQTESSTGDHRFITQGDANNTADPDPVMPVQVRGTVWYAIPYLGWANQVIDGQTRGWAIPALAFALFAYSAWTFGSAARERLTARRGTIGETAEDAPHTE